MSIRRLNCAVFQCPCFYVLSKKSLPLLDTFMEDKKVTLRFEMCKGVNGVLEVIVTLTTLQEAPIEARDAPGNFVSWLIHRCFQQLQCSYYFPTKHNYLIF